MINSDLHITLGNHLFHPKYLKKVNPKSVFMREDIGLCTYQKHHKQKIILFLSAMRSYKDELEKIKIKVHYEYINKDKTTTYVISLINYIKKNNVKTISIFEIEDKWFEKEINKVRPHIDNLIILDTPMFITTRSQFKELCPIRKKPKYKMADFYINCRKKNQVLMDDDKPVGGKWSFDTENRRKIPKDIEVPLQTKHDQTKHTNDLKAYVDENFSSHYGNSDDFNYPTTRKTAINTLDDFLKNKIAKFGDYEDSVDERSPFWFHSVLSPLLNIGLLTPQDILTKINKIKGIPMNSYEGYIRQVIGWREFMRGVYQLEGRLIEKSNFFGNTRVMKNTWYIGNTGLFPLDYSIKSTLKYSYSHHIERLMIQANIMNLCEINPKASYNWFMEMYIDSSDWVMTPNVYSMGMFADGGILATKPYVCGSNYIRKMMNFKKGDWCDILDGLFWRFVNNNKKFFKENARLSMMTIILDKMEDDKKLRLFSLAENFIEKNTSSK
ncbi:MAG: cryptochrome/photolyase family protein [Gammaproteobacteria bacterium]|nr:cryptochrome/photolyase family protein [Gammaproteobacteria bacterium]